MLPSSALLWPGVAFSLRTLRRVLREHGYLVSALVWLALLLNFSALAFPEPDEFVQFGFVQHLFGDASSASAYFFGSAVEIPSTRSPTCSRRSASAASGRTASTSS